jgi:hypothetical protein
MVDCEHSESAATLCSEVYVPMFEELLKMFPIILDILSPPYEQILAYILQLFSDYRSLQAVHVPSSSMCIVIQNVILYMGQCQENEMAMNSNL